MKAILQRLLIILVIISSSSLAQTATAPTTGDGSSGNPYQIATWENLYWISQNSGQWGKYFIQTVNIDFTVASPAINTWASGAGWTPIGNSSTKFTGSYNGQNYTIKGLYINRSTTDNIGLFGYTSSATISYVGLTNGSVSGQSYVGSLIGNCTGGTVSYSYNTCSVTGSSQVIGGLVGNTSSSCTISYSYNSGTATATSTSAWTYLGGLVGQNTGSTISNCYNTGAVTSGYAPVGGLVGYNNTGPAGVVTNCYSTGAVTGYTGTVGGLYRLGGLIGDCCSSASVTNSYWDYQTAGTTASPSGRGTYKTTAEMKTQSTFSGWDFTNVWEIVGGDGANYPRLRNNPDTALPVELNLFTGVINGNSVKLSWQTATEVDNYGFNVECKIENGVWRTIGFVQGYGNSNSVKNYTFIDKIPSSGKLQYRLKQIDFDGTFDYSDIIEVIIEPPNKFILEQNYPNPFNPITVIRYQLPISGNVYLLVFDLLGNKIVTLVEEFKTQGSYQVKFDASKLSSGIYYYQIKINETVITMKMILIK